MPTGCKLKLQITPLNAPYRIKINTISLNFYTDLITKESIEILHSKYIKGNHYY